jgi:hypothetical protein
MALHRDGATEANVRRGDFIEEVASAHEVLSGRLVRPMEK